MASIPNPESVESADGTLIAYQRRGDGPALILVDPAGAYRDFNPMTSLAETLSEHFTVLTYDRRGRGLSGDALPYTVEREVEDIRALISANGGEAYLYGTSSGALLVLQAAASGAPVPRLAVFEPPLGSDDEGDPSFTSQLAGLIEEDRRAEAVEFFYEGIGVPPEVLAGMAQSDRQAIESVAHTLVYDCLISEATTAETLQWITAPALVIDSIDSSGALTGWAEAVARELPNGSHISLPGEWHHVPDEDIARVLVEFLPG